MRSKVVALTSGGIDSIVLTWTLAKLYGDLDFLPLYYCSKNSGAYWEREFGANQKIREMFHDEVPNVLEPIKYNSPEIKVSRARTSYRNQIYLDAVLRMFGNDPSIAGVSMGVCPGQETGSWIHGWTLDEEDHSPTFLEDYLKERKPEWKLWTFKNFEEYSSEIGKKSIRVKLGVESLGEEWLWKTNSCQLWFLGKKPGHWSYLGDGIYPVGGCGRCHSCIARYVAIIDALGYDKTPYRTNPLKGKWLLQYAAEYKNLDLFLEGIPFSKDGKLVRREIRAWLERKLVDARI